MLIGAMNHPGREPRTEMEWMAKLGLDFIDLTLEPPGAASWNVRPKEIRKLLGDHGLEVVGHTAYYLPIGSAFESVRRAACDELKRCLEVFAAIGARWMNVHPDGHVPFHDHTYCIRRNIETLAELLDLSEQCGVGLMLENVPGKFNSAAQLGELLEALPALGLHLDIGHCNLLTAENTTGEILSRYAGRLRHVHLHDNKGGSADLHLPLGTGTLDVAHHIAVLRATGYDSTITLEVFAEDRHYLAHSRDVLRELWERAPAPRTGTCEPVPMTPCCSPTAAKGIAQSH